MCRPTDASDRTAMHSWQICLFCYEIITSVLVDEVGGLPKLF